MMVRKKLKKKDILIGVFFMLVAVAILSFYIWHQAQSFHIGIKTRELEAQVKDLKKEVAYLEAKKASLLTLERVEKIARQLLNLKEIEDERIIYREENKGTQVR